MSSNTLQAEQTEYTEQGHLQAKSREESILMHRLMHEDYPAYTKL